MTILILLSHPDKGSLNHAIAETAREQLIKNGHHVILHDLYDEKFDPLLLADEIPLDAALPEPIAMHCKDLQAADGIVVIHPNWWGQPPAILKGWIDRVIRPGVAYRFEDNDSGDGVPIGLLKAKAAIVFNTSNTPQQRELAAFGDPLENIWKRCVFNLCGVKTVHRRMFEVIITSSPEQRQKWLSEVRDLCTKVFRA